MQNIKYLSYPFTVSCLCILIFICVSVHAEVFAKDVGQMVKEEERRQLVDTDYGSISAVDFIDGIKGTYHLEFIKMEPNSLFLPVQLHADMVLFVHTGSGRLVWTDGDDPRGVDLKKGDICKVPPGSVFYIQSNLEEEREKLRIHAIFTSTDEEFYEPRIGAYSSISDLYTGFDKRVLQSALKLPEEVIEEITNASKPQAIVHTAPAESEPTFWESEARFLKAFLGGDGTLDSISNKMKKGKTYNILKRDPDVENCNGWSRTVTGKDMHDLKGSHIGIFMVNLTKGSMMGPHWNPKATEIAIVIQGRGMIRVVCASGVKDSNCKNMRFLVEEGDVFSIPRFHPMAQISFNNDSLVFIGFSSTTEKNYPQFLAGRNSVLQTLDRQILALTFNVSNTTIDQVLAAQDDSIILECVSCAEEEEMVMEEETRKEKEEQEARKREEEETRRREEEERREREEEATRKREEEETRRREEEERREREEEATRKREEEETRRREEEERREREEEAARKREEEEEAARKRKEEEARQREEERKRQQEEEARRQERERRQHEEEAKRQRREEEEQEEEAERQRREEEEARRQERERRQEEQEAEQRRREEQGRRGEPEREERRREPWGGEEEQARREEEERRRRTGGGPQLEAAIEGIKGGKIVQNPKLGSNKF